MQFSINKSEMTWKSNTGKFDFAFLIFCTQQFTKNLTHANITCQKISHRWIVLFMCTDSFVQMRSASNIHCQAGEETKLISTIFRYINRNELIFFGFCMVYIKTIIHQSVGEYWWILTEPQNGKENIHHCSPPLRWNTIVNYLF